MQWLHRQRLADFRVATRPRALEDGAERTYVDAMDLPIAEVAELGCWRRAVITKDGIGEYDIDWNTARKLLVDVLDERQAVVQQMLALCKRRLPRLLHV